MKILEINPMTMKNLCRRIILSVFFLAGIWSMADVSAAVTTDPVTNLQCNQVFENNFVRYDATTPRAYPLGDTVNNNSSYDVYMASWKMKFSHPEYFDKWGDMWWTSEIKSLGYKVAAGTSVKVLENANPNWAIVKKPSTRTNAKQWNSDFMIAYTIDYDKSDTPNDTSDDTSHVECVYYSVTSCGDGIVDSWYETCDPNDPNKTGWGTGWCTNTCDPIEVVVDKWATCDSLNVSSENVFAGADVAFTCNGTDVREYKLDCGNGASRNSKTGTCEYPSAWTYEMKCSVKGWFVPSFTTSNSCKKTITVKALHPSIQIEKTALDGSNTQTVGTSKTARFKIKVKNIGDENLDRNVVLSDPNSSLCAGTLVLPTNHPSNFKDFKYFGNGNHSNHVLEPGEGFEYTCERNNVTSDFTNTISVNAKWEKTKTTVSDTNSTKVQTERVVITEGRCPYTSSGNKFVVDFSGTKLLSNNNGTYPTEKLFNLGRTVAGGKFKISLYASDGYHSRVNSNQPNERYKVAFQNNGSVLATSAATHDLADNVAFADWSGTVNNSLQVGAFNQVKVMHDMPIDPSSPNSLDPICMLVEPLEDTPTGPNCPYTAKAGEILIDFETSVGRLYSNDGPSGWKTHKEISVPTIPAGNYMVSLAAQDGYANRVNVTQTGEKYFVIFKNSGWSEVARSGTTQDIPDRVANGTWAGKVNNSLTISQNISKLRVQHAVLANDQANSLNPTCMLLKPMDAPQNPEISIDKTDANAKDLDGKRGNDTQTLLVGHTSRFKIKVTNTGSEALKNIVISDAQAQNCAGSISLPGTYPSKWSNFSLSGNGDNQLDPGEYFTYECDKPQTTQPYTNTAGVAAKWVSSGRDVKDTDTSKVILDTDSDSDVCPYTPTGNQILITFRDKTLWTWKPEVKTEMYTNFGTIKKWRYKVSLAAFDGYKDRSNAQPNEQYYVVFRKPDGTEIVRTNATQDIRDDSNNAAWYGVVNDDLNIPSDITKLTTDHLQQTNPSSANSLVAKCMLLDPIGGEEGEPKIAIDKRDANTDDLDNNVGNDTQTVETWKKAVFKIRVTNTGTEDLKDIVVTDPVEPSCSIEIKSFIGLTIGGGDINYDDNTLSPGEYFEYTCEKANTTQDYTNEAIVNAKGTDSNKGVTDKDATLVIVGWVQGPSIIIDKRDANVQDTDGNIGGNDSQTVAKASKAVFKIRVTNNGNEDLKNIVITDAQAPACAGNVTLPGTKPSTWIGFTVGGNGNNGNGLLEPGEYFEYTCEKGNTQADYTNTAWVTAKWNTSNTAVNDSDTSKVIVSAPVPSVTIDKRDANDADADTVKGNDTQTVITGAEAVFKIRVTNNGTEDLKDIVIKDTRAPNCAGSITLPGTTKPSTWSNLTKGGQGSLTNNVLEPGEWFEYECSKANTTANYTNSATVDANGVDSGTWVDATDTTPVKVETPDPSIKIDKTDKNPDDLDGVEEDDSQKVTGGGDAVFQIKVTNDGNEPLKTLKVTDAIAPNCAWSVTLPSTIPNTWSDFEVAGPGNNGNNLLEPGEHFTYTCSKPNTSANYTNTAGAEGTGDTSGEKVTDEDDSEVLVDGPVPSIKVDKTDDNGSRDLDGTSENDTQTVAVGDKATFKITVTNDGSEGLTNIKLVDEVEASCAGDVILPNTKPASFLNFTLTGNGDAVLDPGESFSYNCSKQDTAIAYDNVVMVTGTGVDSGIVVDDEDDTKVLIPSGPSCNGLTVVTPNGNPTHTTDVTCTGTEVEKFEIDCGNGQIFTANGSGTGVETLTKTCNYTTTGNFTPTCKINDTITNNSCQKQVVVTDPSVCTENCWPGGSTPSCKSIEIDDNSSETNTLSTQIECVWNSKVKSIKLVFGDGRPDEIVNDVDNYRHVFDATYTNDGSWRETYQAKCYVSGSRTISNASSNDWKSTFACQDNVSLGTEGEPSSGGPSSGNPSSGNPSSGGPSSGGWSYCGDGTVQENWNSNWEKEQCDKIMVNGSLEWTPSCNRNCTIDPTNPRGNGITVSPNMRVVIWHGQEAFYGKKITLTNTWNMGRLHLKNGERLCVYNKNTNIINSQSKVCGPEIWNLYPWETREIYTNWLFTGNTDNISGTYEDAVLYATVEWYPEGTPYKAVNNVRVSKPSIATVWGWVSLMKNEAVQDSIADVQELAQGTAATGWENFADENNTNLQGVSVWDTGNPLSSSGDETTSNNVVDKAEQDNEVYNESVDVVDNTQSVGSNNVNGLDSSSIDNYNGIENVYILNNKNLVLSAQSLTHSEPTTYIVNGWNLTINGNITSSVPVAFIVKGWDIKISNNVKELDGTYVTIPKDGNGGEIMTVENVKTSNQLVIVGWIYGDKANLIKNRTFISNDWGGAGQISVWTIVFKGASLFSKTPPLLRSFIKEYTDETKVAR